MDGKVCIKCNEEKPIEQYHRSTSSKDGHRPDCKECRAIYQRGYHQMNKEKHNKWSRDYYQTNKKRCKKYNYSYAKNRYRNDINFRITKSLRVRLYQALKHNSKSADTISLLGCSLDELVLHIETLFSDGMTWDNYGEWHIDHIRPCASFNLMDVEQQRECFNWKNLQPLWAEDNFAKKDSWDVGL